MISRQPWAKADTLANDILRKRRGYFIDKVKRPLMKALIILAKRYPEPTRENCKKWNTHTLLDIWDEFFEYEDNPGRNGLFQAIRKLTVGEYEHDSYYAQRMDWFLERLFERYQSGEWKPLEPHNPAGCWVEPSAVEAWNKLKQELAADVGINEEVRK